MIFFAFNNNAGADFDIFFAEETGEITELPYIVQDISLELFRFLIFLLLLFMIILLCMIILGLVFMVDAG